MTAPARASAEADCEAAFGTMAEVMERQARVSRTDAEKGLGAADTRRPRRSARAPGKRGGAS